MSITRPPVGPIDLHKLYPPTRDPVLEAYFRGDDRWSNLVAVKLNQLAAGGGAGAGVSSITAGTGLAGGGTGAVTVSVATAGITNALLATMPTLTLKGNNTGATGAPLDLTTAQVATMLNLAQYAPLASPTFTGVPAAPTATPGTNTTQLASTAFVQAAVTAIGTVPLPSSTVPIMDGTAAIGTGTTYARADHVHPSDTSRAPLASPTFTGTPAAPTATAGTNTTQLATTAFVTAAITALAAIPAPSSTTPLMDGTAAIGTGTTYARADHVHPSDTTRAPLASPTFTGTPAAPTPATADNSTTLATTAFVKAQAYLTANQTITLTGDTTGSGTTSIANTNVALQGRPVAATLPTTNQVLQWSGTQWAPATLAGGGTVTSIATGTGLTGGTITNTGTISMANMAANSLKGNNTGSAAAPVDLTVAQTMTLLAAAPLASPTLTGTPAAPTATAGTNTTQLATTAFVQTAVGSYLPLTGGTLSGNLINNGTVYHRAGTGAYFGSTDQTTVDSTGAINVGSGEFYRRGKALGFPSLAANGYLQLGAVTIEWGFVNVSVTATNTWFTASVTFPIAFSAAPYAVVASLGSGNVAGQNSGFTSPTSTGFTAQVYSGSVSSWTYAYTWIAVGPT